MNTPMQKAVMIMPHEEKISGTSEKAVLSAMYSTGSFWQPVLLKSGP